MSNTLALSSAPSAFPSAALARLVTMHAYCRPAGSVAERLFCDRYLLPLGAVADVHRNYHVHVPGIGADTVLWSCHTDTVHRTGGSQRVRLSSSHELTALGSSCLGADDTAGVFLLCELIRLGVPGRYVFHFGEERGCIGSRNLALTPPDWFADVKYAIAVDRAGYADVISHQLGTRTASDAFCVALSSALNTAAPLAYAPCDGGVYTDTESYRGLIPECTNISVGYHGAHGSTESLDVSHVFALLGALASLDVRTLPAERDPFAAPEYRDDYYFPHGNGAVLDWLYDRPCYSRLPSASTAGTQSVRERLFAYCRPSDTDLDDDGRPLDLSAYDFRDERDAYDRDTDTRIDRDAYLSDVFADVQSALRRQLTRKRGGTR